MRVLHFMNEAPFGFPTELAAAQSEAGAEVIVASFYEDGTSVSSTVDQMPFDLRHLNARSRFDVHAYRNLRDLVKELEVDVFHTHPNFTGSVARLACAGLNVSIIDTEHHDHRDFSALQNLVNAPTFVLADGIVANSESTRDSIRWYEKLFLSSVEITVIHNAVDTCAKKYEFDYEAKLPSRPRLVTVGRMVPPKDQTTLLRAFRLVADAYPEASLTLIGSGPLRNDLEREATNLGISNQISFTGHLPREDVFKHLNNADIFLISSTAEGFCVAAVEAMLCGLPIVASDIPVLHEVIGGGGVFAPPRKHRLFADRIKELLENDDQRATLAATAEARAHKQFSLEHIAEQYLEFYRSVQV